MTLRVTKINKCRNKIMFENVYYGDDNTSIMIVYGAFHCPCVIQVIMLTFVYMYAYNNYAMAHRPIGETVFINAQCMTWV